MNENFMQGFLDEFEKIGEDKEPGWWEKQKGVNRAMRNSDKGFGKIIAKDELVGKRIKKMITHGLAGAGIGAGSGAGIWALMAKARKGKAAVAGAGIGALLGAITGRAVGGYKADKEYLGERGITPKYLGLSAKFSPEAKKKYIDAYREKK